MEEERQLHSPLKMTLYAHSICFMGAVIGYQFGTFNSFFAPFADHVLEIVDPVERNTVASNLNLACLAGVFINSFIGGSIIEALGRHKTLLLTTAANCAALMIYLIPNLYAIYTARLILGFCGGFGFNLSQIIYKEILPSEMGKKMGNMFYIYHTLGIMVPYSFGSPSMALYWRWIFAAPIFVELPKLLLYATSWQFESPHWAVKNSENPEMAVLKAYSSVYNYDFAQTKTASFMAWKKEQEAENTKDITFSTLFSREYIRPFFVCIFVCISNQTCGIAYLVFYSRTIYEGIGFQNTTSLTFFMGFMNFLSGVFITIFSARFSKRINLLGGTTLASLSYFVMMFGLLYSIPLLVIVGSYAFVFFFGMGLGGSMFPYLADAVPPIGISYASSFVWLLNCLNAKFGLVITNYFGIFNLFFIFTMLTSLSAMVLSLFSVETQNKSLKEIQQDFLKLKL